MIIGQKKIFLGSRILWGLALLLIVVVVAGGPGAHLGLWSPLDGFILTLKAGFIGGLALAGLALIAAIIIAISKNRGGMGKTLLILLIGLVLASPVGYLRLSGGGGVPAIHDITTDMEKPPVFIALVGKRGEGANSLAYEADKLPALQKAAYPDIKPLMTPLEPGKALAKALEVANKMGWDITGVTASVPRFEATDRTFWFGFADDIVVVITKTGAGSRIDMRSVSRVGRSDLGTNAKRLRKFRTLFTG